MTVIEEPNPLLEENRRFIVDKVKEEGADLGIAFDGDADRCFLVDEQGREVIDFGDIMLEHGYDVLATDLTPAPEGLDTAYLRADLTEHGQVALDRHLGNHYLIQGQAEYEQDSIGPAIVLVHSQAGVIGWSAADERPQGGLEPFSHSEIGRAHACSSRTNWLTSM